MNAPCEATVLQRQFLQQFEVHVIPDTNGENADLASGGLLGVVENLEGVSLPNSGFPIRQEDDEGHGAVSNVIVSHVVVEQPDAPLQGPIDVCACGTKTRQLKLVSVSLAWLHIHGCGLLTAVRELAGVACGERRKKPPGIWGDSKSLGLSRNLATVC